MARRKIKIDLRLNDNEFERLNNDVQKTGLSREKYLRALIANKQIKPKPSTDLIYVLKELQQINNSLNLIALQASSANNVDADAYRKNVNELKLIIGKLMEVMYG